MSKNKTITKNELKKLSALMIDFDIKDKQALANVVGSSRTAVSLLMNGRNELKFLRARIAKYFGVPYSAIWKRREAA